MQKNITIPTDARTGIQFPDNLLEYMMNPRLCHPHSILLRNVSSPYLRNMPMAHACVISGGQDMFASAVGAYPHGPPIRATRFGTSSHVVDAIVDINIQPVSGIGESGGGGGPLRETGSSVTSSSMASGTLRETAFTAASPPQLCPMMATGLPRFA